MKRAAKRATRMTPTPTRGAKTTKALAYFGIRTVDPGQYIDVRSETRPEVVHHVYTGDSVQTPHCTCEAFRYGTRERDVLFTCKHIDLVVFGKGAT